VVSLQEAGAGLQGVRHARPTLLHRRPLLTPAAAAYRLRFFFVFAGNGRVTGRHVYRHSTHIVQFRILSAACMLCILAQP
jgi:hypothetical protein